MYQPTFAAFYPTDVTLKKMDTYTIELVVLTQGIVLYPLMSCAGMAVYGRS